MDCRNRFQTLDRLRAAITDLVGPVYDRGEITRDRSLAEEGTTGELSGVLITSPPDSQARIWLLRIIHCRFCRSARLADTIATAISATLRLDVPYLT